MKVYTNQLLTYAKFHTKSELEAITAVLDTAGFTYIVEHEKNILDKIYTGESLDPMIALKISGNDFIAVNELMVKQVTINLSSIDKEYYLLHFSVDELINVLKHPLEWNYFDQALAQYLLLQQEVSLPIKSTTDINYEPIGLATQWLILEYLLSIIMMYAGIFIGSITLLAYKTLPNGKKVVIYNDTIRQHAKWLIGIGILRIVAVYIWIFLR